MRYVARDQRFCNILQPRQPHLVAARAHFSHHALHRRVAQECLHPFSHRRQYHLFLVSVPSLRYAVFPCSTSHRSQTANSRVYRFPGVLFHASTFQCWSLHPAFNLLQNLRRRVSGHHFHQDHFSSRRLHLFSSDNLIPRPIPAFHQHIRQQRRHHPLWCGLVENHHRIHAFQTGQNLRALLLRNDRPPLAFQPPHTLVAIHPHNQHILQTAKSIPLS